MKYTAKVTFKDGDVGIYTIETKNVKAHSAISDISHSEVMQQIDLLFRTLYLDKYDLIVITMG